MDIKLAFRWKRQIGQFQRGEYLCVNKIQIGGYDWNITRSQNNQDNSIQWVGYIDLPSLAGKSKRVYGANPDEVKIKMEEIVVVWFQEILRKEF